MNHIQSPATGDQAVERAIVSAGANVAPRVTPADIEAAIVSEHYFPAREGVLGMLAALNVSAAISALEGLIGHKFLNADVYFIDYLPSQLQTQDVLMVCGAALVLSFLATLYPAWRAARTQPAEALRYE